VAGCQAMPNCPWQDSWEVRNRGQTPGSSHLVRLGHTRRRWPSHQPFSLPRSRDREGRWHVCAIPLSSPRIYTSSVPSETDMEAGTPFLASRPWGRRYALPFDVSARQVRRNRRANKTKKQKLYPLSCRLAQRAGGTPHAM